MKNKPARCIECGQEMTLVRKQLVMSFRFLGLVTVPDSESFECSCGESYLPPDTAARVDQATVAKRRQLIGDLPLSAFVESAEAEHILGVSKQALHKNRRVRKGLVYSTEMAGRRLYVRRSVELFARTGDGRFPLAGNASSCPAAPASTQQWVDELCCEESVPASETAISEVTTEEVSYAQGR